jgi:hypothetical protein
MSWNDPDFAMQFLVGRELALRQNVDTSTATKHSLVASMVTTGMLGPIIARQLAIRDAPKPAPAALSTTAGLDPDLPATSPGAASGRVDQIITNFKTWIEEDYKIQKQTTDAATALTNQAKVLTDQAAKMATDRTEALKKLIEELGKLSGDTGGAGGAQQSQQSQEPTEGRKGEKKY